MFSNNLEEIDAYLKVNIPNQPNPKIFKGKSFGYAPDDHSSFGEIVFQTGMVGYPESLTDPSYKKQILTLTYPLVGNYGVPSEKDVDEFGIPKHVESDKIHVSGLVVGEYTHSKRNWENYKTLNEWLIEYKVPGIHGIDTRELTTLIRDHGTLDGCIVVGGYDEKKDNNLIVQEDMPDMTNVVKEVSTTNCKSYFSDEDMWKDINIESSRKLTAVVVDCGVKYNQIRLLLRKFKELHKKTKVLKVLVVNCEYDYSMSGGDAQGIDYLFLSNGPGDPKDCQITIEILKKFLIKSKGKTPVFGICFGHQLLALASGASTFKLKYGNRGHNIPAQIEETKRCCITTQNHGFGVDIESLEDEDNSFFFKPLFTNPNDNTNEGMYHPENPWFSVQFHPEAKAGPEDTNVLFEIFLSGEIGSPINISSKLGYPKEVDLLHNKKRSKVLILGSGGLCIGQSGEFDYSGAQAIKAYREEGLSTVLINPNIATVQTSPDFVDKVYFLPVTPEFVEKVIAIERPDCIALSFGGQSALNCGAKLHQSGILEKWNVEVLGTSVECILKTEDREIFKNHIQSIGEKIPDGIVASTKEQATQAAEKIGYPVLVRAAFALGGLGSGFANNSNELEQLLRVAFSNSDQVIIDKSLRGWKEVEYEVMRDQYNNCITVCNMENFDPLGVHTGESIVVAPSQTLDDDEYNTLRSVAIKTVSSLNVVGECNIQYALDPESKEYFIIEINARLSRSSALASKATGYPIAYIAAKLGLGYSLSELKNSVTKNTTACFEPSLDYCVVKIPRWDLDKFDLVSTHIDSAMKSVGEGMAISRTFEEALQKALRITGFSTLGFEPNLVECNDDILKNPTYKRILAIGSGLYNGTYTIEKIHELSKIDLFFLEKLKNIIDHNILLSKIKFKRTPEFKKALVKAKQLGFSDKYIASIVNTTEIAVRQRRKEMKIHPSIKHIDTVSGEFPCYTNYLYTTYSNIDFKSQHTEQNNKIIVLGSGAYKIGSSVEFDWCAVSCIRQLKKMGKDVIMINCNPETVSTDFDEAEKLYFEEISFETVMDIYQHENPSGIIVSMGGQLPNNIAMDLFRQSVNVIGTSPESIDRAENRYKFSRMLDNINVDQPKWKELTSIEEATLFCNEVQYPVLVRPSYVLSGAAMNVAYNNKDLEKYLEGAVAVSKEYPVVITKFIKDAKEIEVDAVACNGKVEIMAISEHVENAGVHSGDATLVLPPQDLTKRTINSVENSVHSIAKSLNVNGPFNIQFIAKEDHCKVIECNLRVSRSFPFVSKTMGINFVEIATKLMCGENVETIAEHTKPNIVGVKVPQFSFDRLKGADVLLGVEMQSTGEVACFGENRIEAYLKGLIATQFKLPTRGSKILLSIGTYDFKDEFIESTKLLEALGYELYGTYGTADFYKSKGINIKQIRMSSNTHTENVMDMVKNKDFGLIINISERNKMRSDEEGYTTGYKLRRLAVESSISIVTDIKCAKLLTSGLDWYINSVHENIPINPSIDRFTNYKTIKLPALIDVHVHVREPGHEYKEDWESCTKAALAGGMTAICAMPNTDPAITDEKAMSLVEKLSSEKAYCDYGLFVGASSSNVDNLHTLKERSCALKMYLNNTYGPLLLESVLDWRSHLRNWHANKKYKRPICTHAEGQTMSAILAVAMLEKVPLHICHVAKKEEIELIKQAKLQGYPITCEVAPHHLFYRDGDIPEKLSAVKPPLVSQEDVDSLWENLEYIDCFATDHAPHTPTEKHECSCPGFPGLETALPLLLTAVNEGRLTLDDIILRYNINPRKIFGIADQPDTYVEVDMNYEHVIPTRTKYTKCGWTPFAGKKCKGIVRSVVLRGKTVFMDGEVVGPKGYGQNINDFKIDTIQHHTTTIKPVLNEIKNLPLKPNYRANSKESFRTILPNNLYQKSIISTDQFDRDTLRLIFERADEMKNLVKSGQTSNILKGKIIASIFYEPSTRTRCSFESAIKRLGGDIIEINSDKSSVKKGETLEDFVKSMECYADAIILRSPIKGSCKLASEILRKPIFNAGDGAGEHPTQAILDMYTIREEVGTTGGICVGLIGDLKNSRTIHSLVKLLSLRNNVRLKYVSPKGLEMPEYLVKYINSKGLEQSKHKSVEDIIDSIDVLYVTRIQRERFQGKMCSDQEFNTMEQTYNVNTRLLAKAKDNLRIMHPLPRVSEIAKDVDSDPRAAYFRQMEYGLYVRMAILSLVLNK